MDKSNLIVSSSEIKAQITLGPMVYTIDTAGTISPNFSQTVQEIYAIGQKTPIALENNQQLFNLDVSMQSGEALKLIDAVNATITGTNFYNNVLDFPPFSFTYTFSFVNDLVPKTVALTLQKCRFVSDSGSIDRNNVETMTTLSIRGSGLTRVVAPIVL